MKKIYIELTDEQKRQLFPLQDKVAIENGNGTPGIALGQIHFTGRDAVIVCAFVENDAALKVIDAVFPGKKITIAGDRHAIAALKKARKGRTE